MTALGIPARTLRWLPLSLRHRRAQGTALLPRRHLLWALLVGPNVRMLTRDWRCTKWNRYLFLYVLKAIAGSLQLLLVYLNCLGPHAEIGQMASGWNASQSEKLSKEGGC